jgi:hypothetical protein
VLKVSIPLRKQISKLKDLSISDAMKLQASLIDDLVKTYYESLRRKYPNASFDELMKIGHKESFYKKRRREYND